MDEKLFELRLLNEKKSLGTTYFLWLLVAGLTGLAAHRFYLEHKITGALYTAIAWYSLYVVFFTFTWTNWATIILIWWILDGLNIPFMVKKHTEKLRERILEEEIGEE